MRINEGDRLVGAAAIDEGQEVMLTTRQGMAIRFFASDVRSMGRRVRRRQGVRLREGDEVVALVVIEEDKQILTVCEKGYGKRSTIDAYPTQKRGGLGVKDIRVTERNGPVCARSPCPTRTSSS